MNLDNKCKLMIYVKTKDHRSQQLKRGWMLRNTQVISCEENTLGHNHRPHNSLPCKTLDG